MKNKYRVDTIEHWTTEIEAESKVAAQELVNDGYVVTKNKFGGPKIVKSKANRKKKKMSK